MIRNNPIYDNIPGVREERKRMEAQQALRTGAYPSGNPFDQRVKRALMGEAGMDESAIRSAGILSPEREAMSNASRYAANYQALEDAGVPGLSQGMPSGGSSGGRMAPKKPDPFAPGAGYQATDPSDPYYSKTPRRPMRLAEGGPVEGPGGPKDDLINAKLSDGEFVMPAEVVEFYGLDRLHKMLAKAKEGLNEIKPAPQALPTPLPMMMGNPMGQDKTAMKRDNLERFIASVLPTPTPLPVTMPQPTPAFAYGGMAQSMPVPGYAEGGLKIPEELDQSLYGAIQANARAQYDNTGPIAMMGLGIGPRGDAGIASSQAASSATQQTNDRLGSFFDSQNAMDQQSREVGLAQQKRIRDMELMNDPNWQQANPGLYKYQAEQLAQSMGPIAGPQRLTAVVSDQAYGPTMTDSPAFQPMMAPSPAAPMTFDPAAVAAMRSRRADLRAQPAPALANGRQPAPVLSSPMDVPLMRPAPLTMTEKEQQAKPISRNRTPEATPEFEAALAGLTGMQKRRARAGLQMEEATNQRNQARAAIEQANIDARDAAKQADADRRAAAATAAAQEWWKQQQQIGQNFDMARENRNINNAAALNAAEQARADQRALMEAEQKAQADAAARQITMQPIPGTPGYNVAMMGGSRVPGTPLMQAQTTPGPFREGLGRTTYTPIPEAPAPASPPTVRKSAPRPGATKEAPEWEYATMSDLSTRPITIENPRPDQMSDRFKHQYGKAPQTEADWTDAYYLTTGQPRPKTTATAAPAAGTAAPRAKIKAVTPVS
jgi:hypothetical protein